MRRQLVLSGLAALALTGCGSSEPAGFHLNASQVEAVDGSAWPLSVEEVWVRCEQGRAVVAETADGKVYAANGLAKGQGRYRDIDEIWLDDPNVDGLKINLDPVTSVGVAICEGKLPPS